MTYRAALSVLAGVGLLALTLPAQAADLVVNVTGLAGTSGVARVVIIGDPDGNAHQQMSRNVPLDGAKDNQVSTTFLGLAPGLYGVVVIEESGANHAIEKAFTGKVAPPQASSDEIRVTLAEPKSVVVVPLDKLGK
jgi:uncharacterized protein (DUF2141 family)